MSAEAATKTTPTRRRMGVGGTARAHVARARRGRWPRTSMRERVLAAFRKHGHWARSGADSTSYVAARWGAGTRTLLDG